jgi:hypothetical protein
MAQQYVIGIDLCKADEDPSAISVFKKDEDGTLVAVYNGRPTQGINNKIVKYFTPTNLCLNEYGYPLT